MGCRDGNVLRLLGDPIPESLEVADLLGLRQIGETIRLFDRRVLHAWPLHQRKVHVQHTPTNDSRRSRTSHRSSTPPHTHGSGMKLRGAQAALERPSPSAARATCLNWSPGERHTAASLVTRRDRQSGPPRADAARIYSLSLWERAGVTVNFFAPRHPDARHPAQRRPSHLQPSLASAAAPPAFPYSGLRHP